METDLDILITALYVKAGDEVGGTRWLGRPPRLTDSELVCLSVAQAMLGFTSESRWLPDTGTAASPRRSARPRAGRSGLAQPQDRQRDIRSLIAYDH